MGQPECEKRPGDPARRACGRQTPDHAPVCPVNAAEARAEELAQANADLQLRLRQEQRAEQALRESETRYRELADLLPLVVLETDENGTLTFFNRKGLELTGYDQHEVESGLDAFQLIAAGDRERAKDNFLRMLGGDESTGTEYTALRKDGTTRPILLYSSVIVRNGRPAGLRAVATDITEQKEAAEALRTSEERHRTLVESARDAIYTVSPEGVITSLNPAFETITGWPRSEWMGRPFAPIVHPDDLPSLLEGLKRTARGETTPLREARVLAKSGSYVHMEFIGTALFRNGDLVGYMGIGRDITERREAEEKMERLYEEEKELRRRVEDEMKRRVDLTRALAHELKTPLTSVLASSDLLASELDEGPLQGLARNIRQGALNLNARIDELLDLARGEVGLLELKVESTDISALLREIADSMAPLALQRGQSLVVSLPLSLPRVRADATRVQQIVTNLLNNALKFTHAGGTVSLGAKSRGSAVVVEVRDTGRGIPKEQQGLLFEPYRRLQNGSSTGLGLGLALCKTLVELHGGRIWVRSAPGKGATFGFSLPAETPDRQQAGTQNNGKRWQVLMIEDDEEITEFVSVAFRMRWPEAGLISTASGQQGVRLAAKKKPDLVILDLGLPDMDGFDVLQEIRRQSSVPVVIVSVRGEAADLQKGFELGANDYVVKPFKQAHLLDCLKVQISEHADRLV
jgi:PAS domain S-box-containing protein